VLRLLRVAPLLLVALAPAPAWADLHDEFRACMYEYYPRLKKAGAATAVTAADQFCLGFAYWSGTGPVPKDPAQSARWWGQAAWQGHPGAQTMLAYQYGRGLGVARNDAEAVHLLRAAIAQGYGDAMFNLGRLHARGQGVPKSETESRQWLEKALQAGSVDAAVALRDAREQELRKPAAEQAGAAYQAYRAGDLPRAVSLYRAAAEAGNAAAQEALGTLLRTGQGVARDPAAAARLYRQAAELGYGRAQAQLGLAYEAGEGVAESWTEAHAWCLRGARQFDRLGLYCLGRHHQFAIGVVYDRQQAVRLFERAEDQGDGQSKFFARWLRVKENCVGYRNEWERERFLFICAEPVGRAFGSLHQRNMWLSEERNKFERTLRPIEDGFGRGACGAAGGSWGGGGCQGDGGRRFDPMQQDRYGRNLW